MKTLRPTPLSQGLFVLGFNVFMLSVLYGVDVQLTLKLILAINFGALLIVLNWLPKSVVEMDERERLLFLNGQQKILAGTHTLLTLVFAIHLTLVPTMSVTDFMLLVGLPASLYMCWHSFRLRKEMD